ncbi:hypothetical protein CDL12_12445 [Handroanthus impetiginosus]|uniref:Uncharacterized protein n=1 Tax=Handroanthus impetiginosus TaxID=429701 RepID=A0A2G9HBM8_9LAMI|nr:hypothetical protein CDL12_12445 [Handroanthus impetiginosus]
MESPKNSSVNNNNTNIVAEENESYKEEEEEESGWTYYLEDFSNCSNGSFMSSPSLVSDAAWNGVESMNQIRRLNFKNLKKGSFKKYSCDDDFEDTASSPVNSPKVSSLKRMEVNYRRIDDVAAGNFLGKEAGSNNFSRDDKNVADDRNSDQYVDLRKKGLCLVPMSTFMNYFG